MLKKLFSHPTPIFATPKNIIVISGLPRSGTSMMMKMLAEGGLEIISDAVRTADDDNPNGYYEFERVKQLGDGKSQWLAEAGGKVVKIISSLLEFLPADYRYKIIFMERDLKEVLASQQKMLRNRQEQSQVDDAQLWEQYEKHLASIKYWLARQPNMEVLYVSYNDLLSDPANYSNRICEFISLPLNVEKMWAVPSPNLYRNRAKDK